MCTYAIINLLYVNAQKLWGWGLMVIEPGHYSKITAPNLQPTANQERNDQCAN